MRKFREISIEAPEDALPSPYPVPDGMKSWKNTKNQFVVLAIHYTADEEKCSDEWYTKATANLRDDQVEREYEINFESKAGTKAFPYLEHNEKLFRADPPYPIPSNWKIIIGMDYGGTNPTSVTFYAIDPYRRFWAFDEFYTPMNQMKGGLPAFAEWLKKHPYYSRARFIVADPSIFNKNQNVILTKETNQKAYGTLMSVADLLIKEGIHKIQRGNNDRIAGISRVHMMFNFRAEQTKPYLFIGKKCEKQWWELKNLVHKPDDNQNKNPDEDVVKRNDHAFDQLKYSLLSEDIPAEVQVELTSAGITLKALEDEIDEAYHKEEQEIGAFSCRFNEFEELYYSR